MERRTDDRARLITFAIANHPDQVGAWEARPRVKRVERTGHGEADPWLVTLELPKQVAQSLQYEERDLVVVLAVPMSIIQRSRSPIVLPGERR